MSTFCFCEAELKANGLINVIEVQQTVSSINWDCKLEQNNFKNCSLLTNKMYVKLWVKKIKPEIKKMKPSILHQHKRKDACKTSQDWLDRLHGKLKGVMIFKS